MFHGGWVMDRTRLIRLLMRRIGALLLFSFWTSILDFLIFLSFSASDTVILNLVLLVCQCTVSGWDLALCVHPFITGLTHYPFLSIIVGIIIFLSYIDLFAEVAELVVIISLGACLAEPAELAPDFLPWPCGAFVAETFDFTESIATNSESLLCH